MNPNKPECLSSDVKRDSRVLSVGKDGVITLVEKSTTTIKLTYLQFQGLCQSMVEQKNIAEQQVSKEGIENVKKGIKEVEADLKVFAPILKESEKKSADNYKSLRRINFIKGFEELMGFRKEDKNKDLTIEYQKMLQYWHKQPDEDKELIRKEMSEGTRAEFDKTLIKFKRKEKRKGK